MWLFSTLPRYLTQFSSPMLYGGAARKPTPQGDIAQGRRKQLPGTRQEAVKYLKINVLLNRNSRGALAYGVPVRE